MGGYKKKCFIIMPVTTRPELIGTYNGDDSHFIHVLKHIHIPAVEKAGFEAILPITTGSDLITAEIIENLQTADLVLCDMSDLNPNVFFEYGIRTALNKSVCVVKDEMTEKVPFDVAAVNFKEYSGNLGAWAINDQIASIAEHIVETYSKTPDGNKLWKYFGLSMHAEPASPLTDTDEKISVLIDQILELRKDVSKSLHEKNVSTILSSPEEFHNRRKVIESLRRDLNESIGDIDG